ncbi:flagellar export flij [Lucifera butyrica]|uniref:Flagellar FliJ protein n=1 Tax=Lucifera butyrica TaxID=1351585 RepID=A0A498R5V0_9FIRM|nr:flagellar export protein FliJ [Lucifera butyrica]VBB08096.1 flagellar export flij [Lucifera butyrica]
MQRFSFRLETLLKIRKIEKEQAQMKLSDATAKLLAEKETLAQLQETMDSSLASLKAKQQTGLNVAMLNLFSDYIAAVNGTIILQHQKVTTAEQERFSCLKRLEASMQKCKLVEKLKEKRLTQYRLATLQEEQTILDEVGIQIFNHKNIV